MVIHEDVSTRNRMWMKMFGQRLKAMRKGEIPTHCQPSTAAEINKFLFIKENCVHLITEIPVDVVESGE